MQTRNYAAYIVVWFAVRKMLFKGRRGIDRLTDDGIGKCIKLLFSKAGLILFLNLSIFVRQRCTDLAAEVLKSFFIGHADNG